jgi:hypothetical protein
MKFQKLLFAALLSVIAATITGAAHAGTEVTLAIENHRFDPEVLKIPAGEKVKVMVVNKDATPEEFESYELNREKIITGNSKGIVFIGPLDPGEYPFFGDFNKDTARGRVVAE